MHLKFDRNKSEFCVVKIEDVDDSYFNYLIYKVKNSNNSKKNYLFFLI